MKNFRQSFGAVLCAAIAVVLMVGFFKFKEFANFKKILANLEADSRVAEVLVTESRLDEMSGKFITTIKFLEFDVAEEPLMPRYFTFKGNQIQFQSLVVRFDDEYIEHGHQLKGKSVFLFLKAFVLDGKNTQEFTITPTTGIPDGYQVEGVSNKFQEDIWARFWEYALKPEAREEVGIKNAQLEAPGSVFVPGTLYTIKIEHDGGLRIDTKPIPAVLRGETIR